MLRIIVGIGVLLASLDCGQSRQRDACVPESNSTLCARASAECGMLNASDNCGNTVAINCGSCDGASCTADNRCGPGPISCHTNSDCSVDAGSPVCDWTNDQCVPCLVNSDCVGGNEVCVDRSCVSAVGSCATPTDAGCPSPAVPMSLSFQACECSAPAVAGQCMISIGSETSPDCGDGEICSCTTSVCLWPCDASVQCPSGLSCSASGCLPEFGTNISCGGFEPTCSTCDGP